MMPYAMAFLIACAGCSKSGGPQVCPDPADPKVHYQYGSHEDPSRCRGQQVRCAQERPQEGFRSDECGCGCIDL